MAAQAISGRLRRLSGRADRLAARPVGRGEHVQVRHGQLRSRHARRLRRRRCGQHQAESQPGLHHRQESRDDREDRTGQRRDRAGETAGRPHDPGSRQEQRADPRRPAEDHSLPAETGRRPRPNAKSTARSCPPARSTRPRPGRSCTSTGAACNWSCGCWPPTPSTTSPGTSTPTWTTTTSTGPSPGRRSSAGSAGTITYSPKSITVTLDRPGQPRVARALALLLAEINTSPPTLPGDGRPITYTLRQSQ